MRIYLPATARDLSAPEISVRRAHAATRSLAAALPDEDEEGLEVSASLCAADASVIRLAKDPDPVADRRVVIAADVPVSSVRELPADDDTLPGTVELVTPVGWEEVAAVLVDEAGAEADVRLARTGDEEAFERAADADLLWFDVCERDQLAADLGA